MPVKSEKKVYIPAGSITSIVTQLSKNGLTAYDSYWLRLIGEPQQGWIELSSQILPRLQFLIELTNAKEANFELTLIPGDSNYFLFKKLKIDEVKLNQDLMAQTYSVPYKNTLEVLKRKSFEIEKIWAKKLKQDISSPQWKKLKILASVIQKEAGSKEEMSTISSVIYNRLQRNMRLQMDGTLNYGKFSHDKITPKRIRKDNTAFNSYKHRGLPEEVIGFISFCALKAAVYPIKSDYLYFMRVDKNRHIFSKTYKEHKKVINFVKKSYK